MNKILFFLIGLLSIFCMMTCFEINELKSEIVSINKALSHREWVSKIWADRYDFLRYNISATNMRVSIIEQNEKLYFDALKVLKSTDGSGNATENIKTNDG